MGHSDHDTQTARLPGGLDQGELVCSAVPLCPYTNLIGPCREFVSGLIGFIYGDGWRTRIDSLTQLIQASRR